METAHTPEPWRFDPVDGSDFEIHTSDLNVWIADVKYAGKGDTQAEANAKLIAAAPDMLRILKQIASIKDVHDKRLENGGLLSCYEVPYSVINEALSIIQKATE